MSQARVSGVRVLTLGVGCACVTLCGSALCSSALCRSARADDFEGFEEVTVQAPAPTRDTAALVGRVHPLVVHMPIAWLTLLVFAECIRWRRRRAPTHWVHAASTALLWLSVFSFVPAMASGLLRAQAITPSSDRFALAVEHRNLMWLACVLLGASALVLWRGRLVGNAGGASARAWIYRALVLLAYLTLICGADLGGQLVHGVDYWAS